MLARRAFARQGRGGHIRRMRMGPLLAAALLAAIAPAGAVRAQSGGIPVPPKLDRGADPNDWESYYDLGVDIIKRNTSKADAAFYWANRLNPTRAEPLYARWVAYWMLDISEWVDYLENDPRVLQEPGTIASDSLRLRAWERNPLVNQALILYLFDGLPGGWHDDPVTNGWLAYANGFYPKALDYFGAAVRGNPDRWWLRYDVALVYTQVGRYDSAAMQVEAMLEQLRSVDRAKLVHVYESKEMFEYALGLLYAARGKYRDAREAQERALEENLAFAPAHVAMGQLAAARGDTGAAATEFGLAVELSPADGAMRYWYGVALVKAQRGADAVAQLTEAVRLEPYFADGYLALGDARALAGDGAKAAAAYAEFLKRAPRSESANIDRAKRRLAELGAPSP